MANLPSGYKMFEIPNMGAEGKQIYDMLKSQFMQQASGLASGRPEAFAQMEAPIRREFQESILPQIGAQFGLSGTQKSSGFQNALSSAGRSLAENLQSQRYNMQRQSLQDLFGLGQTLLGNQPTEMFMQQQARDPGMGELFTTLGGALPGILAELISPSKENEAGEKEMDWGGIMAGVAKLLPMLAML